MEDNDKLLKTAINLHYHDRPKVVAEATKIIQEYLNKERSDSEYDQVLKALHDLMNDLPSNIFIYFLTTVPLPKEEGKSNSTFSELMKKSRVPLIENMQSVLTEYLNNAMPPLVTIDTEKLENDSIEFVTKTNKNDKGNDPSLPQLNQDDTEDDVIEISSLKKAKYEPDVTDTAITDSCKNLLEICAEYVIINLNELQQFYNTKNEMVWHLVNNTICSNEDQVKYYAWIEDINRKIKLLRMIEAGHVSVDFIREQYGDSEVFLKERNLNNIIDKDAFTVCDELREAIRKFVSD